MKIIIGYDGSVFADAAIDDLSRAGLPAEAEATVVAVAQRWLLPSGSEGTLDSNVPTPASDALPEDVQQQSTRAADRLQTMFPCWVVGAKVALGSPAPVLLGISGEESTDLIVVGSQGRSALRRWFFGSVSQSVSNAAQCSVRVGRKSISDPTKSRVVIAIDGSTSAARAVSEVAGRRWPGGTEVRLVGVVETWKEFHSPMAENSKRWQRTWLMQKISIAADELEQAGLAVSTSIQSGDPKRTIVQDAKRWGAECIFVGATGLSPQERLFLGSVSQAIVSRANCSVEVVRHRHAQESDRTAT